MGHTEEILVNVREKYAPQSVIDAVTSGGGNSVEYVTIHETANTSAGADAAAHANLQYGGNSRSASWHETVDEDEAVLSFREDIQTWNAGDGGGDGNMESYAIEICVNSDGDYVQAAKNAAVRAAYRLHKHNRSISRLVQHNHWSGKDCPNYMREGRDGVTWSKFKGWVSDEMDRLAGGSSSGTTDRTLTLDGKWGESTTLEAQRQVAAKYQDGEVSRQNAYWEDDNPGLTTGWQWMSSGYGDGSPLIEDLQKIINFKGYGKVSVDGLAGPEFFKGLQRLLTAAKVYSGKIDGQIDYPSTTVKGLQSALNKGYVKKWATEAGVR